MRVYLYSYKQSLKTEELKLIYITNNIAYAVTFASIYSTFSWYLTFVSKPIGNAPPIFGNHLYSK